MKTVKIETAVLKAALYCAAKKDVRWYLNGVLIEGKNRNLSVVSTTGAIMFVHQVEGGYDGEDFAFIVPRSVVESVVKTRDKVLEITGQALSRDYELRCGSTAFLPVDGQFPDWRRVCPNPLSTTTNDGITSKFNPELVLDCYSAIATVEGKKEKGYAASLGEAGERGIVSGDSPLTFCVIMPMRGELIKPIWKVL